MVCAARSIAGGSILALALGSLLWGCSLSPDGVKDPVAATPDAGDEPVVDSGAPVMPQGMNPDAAVPPDLATPPDTAPDTARAGPPGWKNGPLVVAVGQGGRRVISPNGLDW